MDHLHSIRGIMQFRLWLWSALLKSMMTIFISMRYFIVIQLSMIIFDYISLQLISNYCACFFFLLWSIILLVPHLSQRRYGLLHRDWISSSYVSCLVGSERIRPNADLPIDSSSLGLRYEYVRNIIFRVERTITIHTILYTGTRIFIFIFIFHYITFNSGPF